jgi:hypothetical protein
LLQLGLIHKVYFYNSATEDVDTLLASTDIKENALIVFPTKLQFHQGLLNNFKPFAKGVFLSFLPEQTFKTFLVNDSLSDEI